MNTAGRSGGRGPTAGGVRPGAQRRPSGARRVLTLATAAVLLAGAPMPAAAQDVAVVGAEVRPVSGPPVEDATVLIRGGTVRAVGTDVEVPDGVPVVDGTGKVVTPGLFDAATRVGLVEVGAVDETRDYAMQADDPVRAAFRVTDGVNPNSTLVPVTRLGGVTTVVANPAGGLVSGQSAVLDLAGATVEEMLVRDRAALVASFGPDAAGGARGAAALRLREALGEAEYYAANRRGYDRGSHRPLSQSRLDLEALQGVLTGARPLVVEVHRASDILAVLRLAREHGLRLVVQGGAEAWMVADELAAADVPVIVKPLTNAPEDFSRLGARFDNAALLHRAGVRVVISTFDAHNARNLRWEAGNAMRFGLPPEVALRAVTLEPARAFGLSGRYGSLEPGKVGNVVVWSGDPLSLSSRPERVIVRGRVVPRDSRQEQLFRRYRDLRPGEPPAYRAGKGPDGTP